jgi:hypothetical protein
VARLQPHLGHSEINVNRISSVLSSGELPSGCRTKEQILNFPRQEEIPSVTTSPLSIMDAPNDTLASVGQDIRSHFVRLQTSQAINEAKWAKLDHEMQRFELWARNLGLFTGGHSSLDYRFRDAQLVFDHSLSLLRDLAKLLTQGKCGLC